MPITINGVTNDRAGLISASLSAFATDLDGTVTGAGDNVGSMNPTLSGFNTNLIGQHAAPNSFDGLIDTTLDSFSPQFIGNQQQNVDGLTDIQLGGFTSSLTSGAVTDQDLRDIGYILVDDYPGVDPTGVLDSITGINQAILDGKNQRKAVWFSAGATYRVSDTIRIGMWDQFDTSRIQGGGDGSNRPLFILDDGATGFGSAGSPRPVMCLRLFPNGTNDVWPSDPMDQSGIWEGQANIAFYQTLSNFRIDCGNNAGAFGIYAPAAQRCSANDIEITATNALGGWWGLLGRNAAIINLKITGGVWQVNADMSGRIEETQAGVMIAGLTLVGSLNTTTPILTDDFVPLMITGFDITMGPSGSVWNSDSISRTGYGILTMVDGIIRSQGGLLFDNDDSKTMYLRNVYVTGTDSLIKSGSNATVTGTGTWKRIDEYASSDPTGYNASSALYPTKSMIDGVISSAEQPVIDITSSASAPTVNYVDRHIISVPRADSGPFENIEDYGATRNPDDFSNSRANDNTAESSTAIAAAISAAETAGHNRVFVPNGIYYIDEPISLLKDTVFIGTGCRNSIIYPHDSWRPLSKSFLMETANDATGTAHFSSCGFLARTADGSLPTEGPYEHDWFSYINWRTGKNSSSIQQYNGREFIPNNYRTNPKDYYRFEGNGGGKHYAFTDAQGRAFGNVLGRGLAIALTTQPIHIYGCNMEITKSSVERAETNIEIQASSAIRIYGCKREGTSATVLINDSTNVCLYGLGRQEGDTYVCKVIGTSNNLTIAPCVHDSSGATYNGDDMMLEDLDSEPPYVIEFPEGFSIYRRGTPDDSLTVI